MKLADYLKAVRECPDELLTAPPKNRGRHILTWEFGVCDNYPISLDCSLPEFLRDLTTTLDFSRLEEVRDGPRTTHRFTFNPGTVLLQVRDSPFGASTLRSGYQSECQIERLHQKKQTGGYRIFALLHEDNPNKMPDVSATRAIAIAIDKIGRYVLERGIPCCFPVFGWKHNSSFSAPLPLEVLSRIVYFPDSVDDEMQRRAAQLIAEGARGESE